MILNKAKDINQSEDIKQNEDINWSKDIKQNEDHMSAHIKPHDYWVPWLCHYKFINYFIYILHKIFLDELFKFQRYYFFTLLLISIIIIIILY